MFLCDLHIVFWPNNIIIHIAITLSTVKILDVLVSDGDGDVEGEYINKHINVIIL